MLLSHDDTINRWARIREGLKQDDSGPAKYEIAGRVNTSPYSSLQKQTRRVSSLSIELSPLGIYNFGS